MHYVEMTKGVGGFSVSELSISGRKIFTKFREQGEGKRAERTGWGGGKEKEAEGRRRIRGSKV